MHGQSPYFLMEVLPPKMMHEFLNSGKATPDGLVKLWALYDDVYKAALRPSRCRWPSALLPETCRVGTTA